MITGHECEFFFRYFLVYFILSCDIFFDSMSWKIQRLVLKWYILSTQCSISCQFQLFIQINLQVPI